MYATAFPLGRKHLPNGVGSTLAEQFKITQNYSRQLGTRITEQLAGEHMLDLKIIKTPDWPSDFTASKLANTASSESRGCACSKKHRISRLDLLQGKEIGCHVAIVHVWYQNWYIEYCADDQAENAVVTA